MLVDFFFINFRKSEFFLSFYQIYWSEGPGVEVIDVEGLRPSVAFLQQGRVDVDADDFADERKTLQLIHKLAFGATEVDLRNNYFY